MRVSIRVAAGLVLAAGGVASFAAPAAQSDIAWPDDGLHAHRATIAPGDALRLCASLRPPQVVAWRFDAGAALTFALAIPTPADGIYYERHYDVRERDGRFEVPMPQRYCWIWLNEGAQGATLDSTLRLERVDS